MICQITYVVTTNNSPPLDALHYLNSSGRQLDCLSVIVGMWFSKERWHVAQKANSLLASFSPFACFNDGRVSLYTGIRRNYRRCFAGTTQEARISAWPCIVCVREKGINLLFLFISKV